MSSKRFEPSIWQQVKICVLVTNLVTFSVFLKSVYISTKGYVVYGSYGMYIVVGDRFINVRVVSRLVHNKDKRIDIVSRN